MYKFFQNNSHLILGAVKIVKEEDEAKKTDLVNAFKTEVMPTAMTMFEKILKANGGKLFVGKEVLTVFNTYKAGIN